MKEVVLPDGTIAEFPDDMSNAQIEGVLRKQFAAPTKAESFWDRFKQAATPEMPVMALMQGLRKPVDTGADAAASLAERIAPDTFAGHAQNVRDINAQSRDEFARDYPSGAGLPGLPFRLAGEILGTTPAVKAAGAVTGLASPALGTAIASYGAKGGGMLTRAAGGGVAGGLTAAQVDPSDWKLGAAFGAAGVPLTKLATMAGSKIGDFIRPFTKSGQEGIAGEVLRSSADNADDAIRNLRNAHQVVPGSDPTSAMSSGDFGLTARLNTVQDKLPEVASAAHRASEARNLARQAYATAVGGTDDVVSRMKDARDAITEPMRNSILRNAQPIPVAVLDDPIRGLASNPGKQSKPVQDAYAFVRSRIESAAQGADTIDPRALYEVRKDVNDAIAGKFSKDAPSLAFARKELTAVKKLIDLRIEQASGNTGVWREYLSEYAARSKEAGQLAEFQDVIRRVGTGSVDVQGAPILSAAKLNNILKNETPQLKRSLTTDQLDSLRRLASDLSAEAKAATASRPAFGSPTFKFLEAGKAIDSAAGFVPGGGGVSRVAQWAQQGNKDRIMALLGDSVLNPDLAAHLLQVGIPPVRAMPNMAYPSMVPALALTPGLLGLSQ